MASGRVGDLTGEQSDKLDLLRLAVEDILSSEHDDYYLTRWLRARHYDVVSAEAMLRRHMQWKKLFNVDNLIDEFDAPEVLKKYYPGGLVGHDRDHCPVWIIPMGNMDIKGLFHSVKKTDFSRYTIRQLQLSEEDMKVQSERTGKMIDTHSFILDMENFAMKDLAWKPAVDLITQLITMFEDHYPERLKKVYVVNAPKYFPLAYALVKPFLADETANKVYVYAKDDMWREKILYDIDEQELPAYWGGLKTDPVDGDPRCPSLVCLGGQVPCSYYTAPSRRLSIDSSSMDTIIVDKKSCQLVEMLVEVPGSMLKWEFKTDEHDIGFSVYRQRAIEELEGANSGDDEEIIVPPQRVNSHLVPEDGLVIVDKPGKYVIKFDNTYSWYRSKKVMHSIMVVPPIKQDVEKQQRDMMM
ncbi:SEC14-like protein 2 [Halotydeus destructor]|nr:SEC14-like protein 2 [Halotydeus destructor]